MKIGVFTKTPQLRENQKVRDMISNLSSLSHELYDITRREDLLPSTDMVLSIGGDGTFLSAAKRVGDSGVPILGINLGRIGFLSEFSPEDATGMILSGDYLIEDRTMLRSTVLRDGVPQEMGEGFWPYTLNEVTLHRQGPSVLGIHVVIDDVPLPTYWADGLLVSTSSGSTAYSLSVGGPICMPDAGVLIIAPIAPHNLNVRPLIVPDTTRISIRIETRDCGAVLAMDNRTLPFSPDTLLDVAVAHFSLRRVKSPSSNFVKALTSKLFWGEDIRNSSSVL